MSVHRDFTLVTWQNVFVSKLHLLSNSSTQIDSYYNHINMYIIYIIQVILSYSVFTTYYFSECSKHCSLCYNETECYECTQGYFLNTENECESEYIFFSSCCKKLRYFISVSVNKHIALNFPFLFQNVPSTVLCVIMKLNVMSVHKDSSSQKMDNVNVCVLIVLKL